MKIFNSVSERIKAESPSFFKKLKYIAITLGSSVYSVIFANSVTDLGLPPTLLQYMKYTVAICVAVAGTSILTKK